MRAGRAILFRTILAVAALGTGSCCWESASSCVQQLDWGNLCLDRSRLECICDSNTCDSDAPDPLDDIDPDCLGVVESGTCASNGYTVECGGYSVHPGAPCLPQGPSTGEERGSDG